MKIIIADNLNLDYFNETLIAENVSDSYAEEIAKFLNKRYSYEESETCFKAVPDDHKLQTFDEQQVDSWEAKSTCLIFTKGRQS